MSEYMLFLPKLAYHFLMCDTVSRSHFSTFLPERRKVDAIGVRIVRNSLPASLCQDKEVIVNAYYKHGEGGFSPLLGCGL